MSFGEVQRRLQQIEVLARSLLNRSGFDDLRVLLPDPANPEAAFIRGVSWLYCLYFEAGRVSLTFLRRLGEGYSLVDRTSADGHVENIRCLRTELHHNLGLSDSDEDARRVAEKWRRGACGTAVPRTAEEWRACYTRLVNEACGLLGAMEDVLRHIEGGSEEAQAHVDEWCRRLSRNWNASDFDPVIDDVKYRLGRGALNRVAFRNRYVEKWRKRLELLEDDFDFEYEATRLIEKTLLDEEGGVLPITGVDVMQSVGIGPGPEVGRLLEVARRYFEVERCGKERLLEHLRDCASVESQERAL